MDTMELSNEELLALEAELNADYDDEGSESDREDPEMDILATKLRSALHDSENDPPNPVNPLSSLPGFESFNNSTQIMNKTIDSYKEEISAVRKMEGIVATRQSISNPTAEGIDNLSAGEVFALAIGSATRGAVSYLISEIERLSQLDVDVAREKQLKEVEAERLEKEAEILRLQEKENSEQDERLRKEEEARAAAKELSRIHAKKMRVQMEEIERQAQEEHDKARREVEEEQRRKKEKRKKIAEAEEKRWTLASRAVGFVQSRLRGVLGRKKAEKKKEEVKIEYEERIMSGFSRVDALVRRRGLRRGVAVWRAAAEGMRSEEEARKALEERSVLTIQSAARYRVSRSKVAKVRRVLMEVAASLRIQSLARMSSSKRHVEGIKTTKKVDEQNRIAREEAAKKYAEEQRMERVRKELERIEKNRAEVERQCMKEMEEKAKESERRRIERAGCRKEAEEVVENALFRELGGGSSGGGGVDVHRVWEKRREAMVGSLKEIIEGWGGGNVGGRRKVNAHDDFEVDSGPIGGGQQIEEDMLAGMGDLSKLQSLTLNVEQIEDASNLSKMGVANLTSLSLNVNKLSSLKSLGKLRKLERLSVKDNKIKSVVGMKGLQSLVEVLLDVNCLTTLEQLAGRWVARSEVARSEAASRRLLVIWICGILLLLSLRYGRPSLLVPSHQTLISRQFAPCSCWFNLATLSANTNKIKSLPSDLSSSLPSLCMLNLYQNAIERVEVDTFRHLPSLTALDLGRNKLSDSETLGRSLSLAPTLRRLVLSQNSMVKPPALNLPLLQQLWLSGNKISGMKVWGDEDVCFLPCLLELYLQENAMVEVGGVGSLSFACPSIQKLDLSFNALGNQDDVVDSLLYLDRLASLDVQDNPVAEQSNLNDRILQSLPSLKTLNNSR